MQAQGISPAERADLLVQSGVMTLVLTEHPTLLTLGDVVMEVGASSGELATTQAVHDLVTVGLLHREGGLVLPTRAALQFDRLSA